MLTMPTTQRAVKAPREKPKQKMRSCGPDQFAIRNR